MKKGEVWIINLDPTVGAEIKKSRPCILVGNDESPEKRLIKIREF